MSIEARTSRRQCSAQRVSVRFTAASALAVACGLASAQSGVTLYGRVAGGIDYTNKIDTGSSQSAGRLQYGSNQWGTSMWGLRASEDLGGGLKAVMNLENGFTSADGVASGGLFNRYAVAGLSSSTYGTLLVGRAMGIPDSEVYTIDPMGLQFMSAATFQGNRTWGSRTKAITYNSPVWGGWSFRAQAGLNGTAGNFNAGRQLAASIGYQNGPLMLKGFYEDIRDSAGQFTNLYTASRLYTAGGTYQIGDAKLFGGYSQIQSSGNTIADADNPTGATRQQTYWIGTNYQMTPAATLVGGVYRTHRNHAGGTATLLTLGVNYALSKRTLLYGTVGTVLNGKQSTFSVEANGGKPAAGASQQGVYTGIVHVF
ncbi:porin [Ralstonia pseudosolanacearum]|uniref:porin n=1 Tax=Ralstonia pseudosolanacearum TaxID=1310165 RepID=UPI0026749B62|nr:porin [Ralstonia pseudosolanacearum]MDO3622647.1 porin [Ralstonia pseudosolanacearum]